MKKISIATYFCFIATLFVQGVIFLIACIPPYSFSFKHGVFKTADNNYGNLGKSIIIMFIALAVPVVLNLIVAVIDKFALKKHDLINNMIGESGFLILLFVINKVSRVTIESREYWSHDIPLNIALFSLSLAGISLIFAAAKFVVFYFKKRKANFWVMIFTLFSVFQIVMYLGNFIVNIAAVVLGISYILVFDFLKEDMFENYKKLINSFKKHKEIF